MHNTQRPNGPGRIAVFIRASSESQKHSHENQMREIMAYLQSRNWPAPWKVYSETASSTGNDHSHRRAFNNLMMDIRTRQFDTLVCWEVSRLTRNYLGAATLYTTCQEAGVGIVDVSMNFYCDPHTHDGALVFKIRLMVAEEEAKQTRLRSEAGRSRRKAEGLPLGGRPRNKGTTLVRDRLIDDYNEGVPWKELAAKHNLSLGYVGKIIANARQEGRIMAYREKVQWGQKTGKLARPTRKKAIKVGGPYSGGA